MGAHVRGSPRSLQVKLWWVHHREGSWVGEGLHPRPHASARVPDREVSLVLQPTREQEAPKGTARAGALMRKRHQRRVGTIFGDHTAMMALQLAGAAWGPHVSYGGCTREGFPSIPLGEAMVGASP